MHNDLHDYRNDQATLPEGFDTVAGFVATKDPGLFDWLSDDPVRSFRDDEERLAQRAERWGIPFCPVPASPAYVARGFDRQLAFPAALIVSLYEGGLC